jgi:hypothetical protein
MPLRVRKRSSASVNTAATNNRNNSFGIWINPFSAKLRIKKSTIAIIATNNLLLR